MLTLFTDLYPNVMISSTNPAYNLTIANTASPSYTLKLMSVVAIIFLPVVLAYTAWNYYVFRKRISSSDFTPPRLPGTQPPAAPSRSQAAVGAAQRAGEDVSWQRHGNSPKTGDATGPGPGWDRGTSSQEEQAWQETAPTHW